MGATPQDDRQRKELEGLLSEDPPEQAVQPQPTADAAALPPTQRPRSRVLVWLVVGVVVTGLLIAGLLYWFVVRDPTREIRERPRPTISLPVTAPRP